MPAAARPFITDEVATLGQWVFEAGLSAAHRRDEFKEPETHYDTVALPFEMRIGVHERLDLGFDLTYLSQRIETTGAHYTGSRSALFSPMLRFSPSRYFGTQFHWHTAIGDEADQELPIARGDDFELKALFSYPARIPLLLNVGYVWKGDYHSRQGVAEQRKFRLSPGDIFETSASIELPLAWGLSVIGEGAYYHVETRAVDHVDLPGSSGEAADASVGLNWRWKSWDLGAAASFGLMDESHTSFDLERGSGDVTYRFQAHYRLTPRKPEAFE